MLEKYIRLFDAIEHSWFYSRWFNRNKKAVRAAKKYSLPLVATSDTHFFNFMDENYTIIDAEEFTVPAILDALRAKRFQNLTSPRKFWRDMVILQGGYLLRNFVS